MNFEELSSQEFADDEGGNANIDTASHSSKRSDSRRKFGTPFLKKASSIRNVMLGKISSSEQTTPLLAESSDDTESSEEMDEATNKDVSAGVISTDPVTGKEAAEKSQSSRVPSPADKAPEDISWERNPRVAGGVSRRRREKKRSLSRDGPASRREGKRSLSRDSLKDNLESSERSLGRNGPPCSSPGRGRRPQLVKQRSQRRSRSGGRRPRCESTSEPKDTLRNLETALNPQPHMLSSQVGDKTVVPLKDDSPMEQLRLAPSKSVSAIEKRCSGAANVPIRRSTSSGDCRRRGRRASYKMGDSVPIIVPADINDSSCSPAVSNGEQRGRRRTCSSDSRRRGEVDGRLEWRSKSNSRRKVIEPQPSHTDKAPEDTLRDLETALNPELRMPGSQVGDKAVVPLKDDSPMEQLRLAPSKSVSAIEKRRSGAANVPIRRSTSSGTCRRRGRRASYKMGDSVPIIVPADINDSSCSPAVSNGEQRGRRRTCSSDSRRRGEVDRRFEWRSKSNSRRKVIEPQPCGEKDVMTSNGRRLSLLKSSSRNNLLDGFEEDDATTSYGKRLSLLR